MINDTQPDSLRASINELLAIGEARARQEEEQRRAAERAKVRTRLERQRKLRVVDLVQRRVEERRRRRLISEERERRVREAARREAAALKKQLDKEQKQRMAALKKGHRHELEVCAARNVRERSRLRSTLAAVVAGAVGLAVLGGCAGRLHAQAQAEKLVATEQAIARAEGEAARYEQLMIERTNQFEMKQRELRSAIVETKAKVAARCQAELQQVQAEKAAREAMFRKLLAAAKDSEPRA